MPSFIFLAESQVRPHKFFPFGLSLDCFRSDRPKPFFPSQRRRICRSFPVPFPLRDPISGRTVPLSGEESDLFRRFSSFEQSCLHSADAFISISSRTSLFRVQFVKRTKVIPRNFFRLSGTSCRSILSSSAPKRIFRLEPAFLYPFGFRKLRPHRSLRTAPERFHSLHCFCAAGAFTGFPIPTAFQLSFTVRMEVLLSIPFLPYLLSDQVSQFLRRRCFFGLFFHSLAFLSDRSELNRTEFLFQDLPTVLTS